MRATWVRRRGSGLNRFSIPAFSDAVARGGIRVGALHRRGARARPPEALAASHHLEAQDRRGSERAGLRRGEGQHAAPVRPVAEHVAAPRAELPQERKVVGKRFAARREDGVDPVGEAQQDGHRRARAQEQLPCAAQRPLALVQEPLCFVQRGGSDARQPRGRAREARRLVEQPIATRQPGADCRKRRRRLVEQAPNRRALLRKRAQGALCRLESARDVLVHGRRRAGRRLERSEEALGRASAREDGVRQRAGVSQELRSMRERLVETGAAAEESGAERVERGAQLAAPTAVERAEHLRQLDALGGAGDGDRAAVWQHAPSAAGVDVYVLHSEQP
ncbi:MAG: hypothetical protein E6J87_26810, partial [Deltaproteobacteria bacterium]